MLHEFLATNRADLIDRCRLKVAQRRAPKASDAELEHGIPHFLDQLVKTLRVEQTSEPLTSRMVSGESGGEGSELSEIGTAAAQHGRELLRDGVTVDQVVHSYGDLCQAITDLAFEQEAPVGVDEFRTLNRCLDNAIADSVSEFAYQRDLLLEDAGVHALNERLGFFAHELRNLIQNATLAVSALKAGNVGLAGATGAVLDRSLIGLRNLVDRSLADVRVSAGMPPRRELIPLAAFIAELKISAALEAQARGCGLDVSEVDPGLAVEADRELLFSAIGNLLQNAFKFTEQSTEVVLHAYAAGDRVLIEVEDCCGGLPVGDAERMFKPFAQESTDKSGLGLGLSICRRSVEANGGLLSVRDMPGAGCVFTIDLPRHAAPRQWPVPSEDPVAAMHAGRQTMRP
jgi:signal transduction histidine kinase